MNSIKSLFLIVWLLLANICAYAQTDIIEIDTLTITASKVMPFNKAFTVKIPIEADEVSQVNIIEKYKYHDLVGSILHHMKNKPSYTPPTIPNHYYHVKKTGDKYYLILSFADKYMLKPSASYYIIIAQNKLGSSALDIFDNYYEYVNAKTQSDSSKALDDFYSSYTEYEKNMKKTFGENLYWAYIPTNSFIQNQSDFTASFKKNLKADYDKYTTEAAKYLSKTIVKTRDLSAAIPNLDYLTINQLLVDSTINKDALNYIMGKDLANNNAISDINTVVIKNQVDKILNGAISLECIYCNDVNIKSTLQDDFKKRIANIEASMALLNTLKRSLYLVQAKSTDRTKTTTSISNTLLWMDTLQSSKNELKKLLKLRKAIETKIIDSVYAGQKFNLPSIVSGNSFLNFETRNKVLLTPDFGIVSSAFSKDGKKLDYGIVPYLGFHINFMAVDKDLPFNSYKKNWKQYLSIMVGWSLVNMQKDSSYANFFEKSSILTGIGYRLNNVIRISTGSQWLFKLGTDANNSPTRRLQAVPYLGISFDLNIKQYLNGFVDLLSGIGKTANPKTVITQN